MKDITQEERKIYALYDNNTIRVYQAYNQAFFSMDDVQMWMGYKRKSRKSLSY